MKKLYLNKKIYKNLSLDFDSNSIFINGFLGNISLKLNDSLKIFNLLNKDKDALKNSSFLFWISKNYYRTFLSNIFLFAQGVCFGWSVYLELIGRNYTVYNYEMNNKKFLFFDLGYSHNILFEVPKGIEVGCRKKIIFLYGLDLVQLKNICFLLIKLRPINIYKGKGLKFLNQKVHLKTGKQSQYK